MNKNNLLSKGLIAACIIMLGACSKHTGSHMGAADDASGLQANGLGLGSNFAGQEPGESYTTEAPHNQVYLFSYDAASLAPKYLPSLNAQAEYLKTHAGARVLVAGNTDERGSREYNIALGERRANAVAEILGMSGVSEHQMRIVSYGKERPVSLEHSASAHRQNRRVEFTYEATR